MKLCYLLKQKKYSLTQKKRDSKKIARCFEQLEQNPCYHPNIKSLKGNLTGYYRYRIGDYRVTYQVNDDTNQVVVSTIAHRSEVYE